MYKYIKPKKYFPHKYQLQTKRPNNVSRMFLCNQIVCSTPSFGGEKGVNAALQTAITIFKPTAILKGKTLFGRKGHEPDVYLITRSLLEYREIVPVKHSCSIMEGISE